MEQEWDETLQQIAESALTNSVVHLDVGRGIPLLSLRPQYTISKVTSSGGSGFFIEEHLIVTNCHVILGATSVSIELSNTEDTFHIESVKSWDFDNDLIVLKVTKKGTPLKLGDSDRIANKDLICAAGYPKGNPDITHGTIDGIQTKDNRLRMKIGTARGSSGCPIMNRKGEVIGIDTSSDKTYSYAIPSNTLKSLIRKTGESLPFKEWQELPHIRAYYATDVADDMLEKGEFKEAVTYYDIAIELKPDIAAAYKGCAVARMGLGMFRRAMEDYLTCRKLNPKSLRGSGFWSYLTWKWVGFWIIVGHFLIKLLKKFISESSWYRFRGIGKSAFAKSATKDGEHSKARMLFKEAISDFSEAINLEPEKSKIYNSRGWTKYLLGKVETDQENEEEAKKLYQEAVSDSDMALQLELKKPKYRSAFFHTRGVAKAGLGDHCGAIEDFDVSIKLYSEKALYFHDRGLSKEALGQQEAAEIDFSKAKGLDPKIKR
ncbi:MAG: trypsin-like peptidase domain-containing protein [Candidatus Poribacteria bacterium]|nr:trypsin-like peptidase domain-containing protein [Candidatus Poribacteria bacterium]